MIPNSSSVNTAKKKIKEVMDKKEETVERGAHLFFKYARNGGLKFA